MHIAIDDTYGANVPARSRYVTPSRRTHVGVCFKDEDVDYIRAQIRECLNETNKLFSLSAKEFHFVEIMNGTKEWKQFPSDRRLDLLAFFGEIYSQYKWPVFIQTIDDRTLADHNVRFAGRIGGDLDLSKRQDLSLLFLIFQIKEEYKRDKIPITILIDEGRKRPGASFGATLFHDWPATYQGQYSSSVEEPLLQIADFMAYCINRSTHVATKECRSASDYEFMDIFQRMNVQCSGLVRTELAKDFTVEDFDLLHTADRISKGLEKAP